MPAGHKRPPPARPPSHPTRTAASARRTVPGREAPIRPFRPHLPPSAVRAQPVRRQCGAAAGSRPGLQPRRLPPHPGTARGAQSPVDDNAEGPPGEDRRQDRPARQVDPVADDRGADAPRVVAEDTRCHRDVASVAIGSMSRAAAATGRASCRFGNRVHLPSELADSPVRPQSPADDAGCVRPSGGFPLLNLPDAAQCACQGIGSAGHRGNVGQVGIGGPTRCIAAAGLFFAASSPSL